MKKYFTIVLFCDCPNNIYNPYWSNLAITISDILKKTVSYWEYTLLNPDTDYDDLGASFVNRFDFDKAKIPLCIEGKDGDKSSPILTFSNEAQPKHSFRMYETRIAFPFNTDSPVKISINFSNDIDNIDIHLFKAILLRIKDCNLRVRYGFLYSCSSIKDRYIIDGIQINHTSISNKNLLKKVIKHRNCFHSDKILDIFPINAVESHIVKDYVTRIIEVVGEENFYNEGEISVFSIGSGSQFDATISKRLKYVKLKAILSDVMI